MSLLDAYGKIRGAVVRRYSAGGVWMTHPLLPAWTPDQGG